MKAVQPAHLRNRDFDVECIQRQAGALKRLRPKRKVYDADPSFGRPNTAVVRSSPPPLVTRFQSGERVSICGIDRLLHVGRAEQAACGEIKMPWMEPKNGRWSLDTRS
ncbi:hypothetical protein RHE_PF00478 (plasmid) [Rhizobium etli CFN 42]|uniref:Uncharacterized protein n=1 Tax=Rhizobium etli (strain ATCC 51251 / DSM 11541 / JCM 21823 / NBRC 15573 / CFN 42) TaxID=347834 RepID=Q2JYG8_RHIEC|nr:hypothetical protein RHE_PF00478 [Rhizobium etli CFN 42]